MKKFTKVLVLTVALMAILAIASYASPHGIIENDPISISKGNATIDGFINEDEGYSDPAFANYDTLGFYWAHNPLSTNASIYYTYDDDGIIIGVDVVEGLEAIDERDGTDLTGLNKFNYSTGLDDLDLDTETGENEYGWNGDVVGLMFDPLGAIVSEGFTGSTDLSSYYMVGLFQGAEGEDDYIRVYRSHTNNVDGEVTDQVEAAGRVTEEGWMFEIKISWDFIIEDTDYATMGMVQLTKDMIMNNASEIRTNFLYQDRFFDEEQGAVATWGRYMTAPTTLPDGTPGHMGSGEGVASYGIKLVVNNIVFVDVPEDAWYYDAAYYCAGKGYITGNDKGEFMPNANLTREQFVVILARVAGADLSKYAENNFFTDVKEGAWYDLAIRWAYEEGLVLGVDASTFGVGQAMTREQIATMFFRYANLTGSDMSGKADLTTYTDGASISSWAKDACAWAVDAGIIKSTSTSKLVFSPKMTVTRAQAAQIFMNYDNIA